MTRLPGLVRDEDGTSRCWWGASSPDYVAYHDAEWGFPVTDDVRLFEKICLEGFQAGLSWILILRRREYFRTAFADFDYDKVVRFDKRRVDRLVKDPGIIRHRGKIESTINNAKRARELTREFGSLAAYFWSFEPPAKDRPKRLTRRYLSENPHSPASAALSKDLRKRGWTFVGPTTLYAFMQAMGLVNDHLPGCAAHEPAERARARLRRPT
ncbi:MAG: DNA-3-methyladenine glycosylase I [Candidatus Binatia bacterium]|nr:DNA-3-methyladenine glycosylase I [Candidatus Binatia bacterium]